MGQSPLIPIHRRWGMSLAARLRAYLFAGILVTAPISITLYIAWIIIDAVDRMVAGIIPAAYNPESLLPVTIPGVGLLVVLLFLILVGMFAAGFVGRGLVHIGERVVGRMPVLRGIYSSVKQIFETVLANKSNAFREVVLVEFPRRGAWTVAFVTAPTTGEVKELVGDEELLNVFVPTTPNPTGGYLLFVPRREVRTLSMTVEEGLKFIISGGIVTGPDRRPVPEQDQRKLLAGE